MEGPDYRLWRCVALKPPPEHEALSVFGSLVACMGRAKGSIRRNNGEAIAIADLFEEEPLGRLQQLRKQVKKATLGLTSLSRVCLPRLCPRAYR